MGRAIAGALCGYAAMVVIVVASIAGTWAVLGPEGSFTGEGPYPSAAWNTSNVVFGFLAALVAGWVARKVGRGSTAVRILVGLMVVLGLYSAITAESSYQKRVAKADIDKQVADLSFTEAGVVAKSPTWYVWLIPVIGAAGALVGGRERE